MLNKLASSDNILSSEARLILEDIYTEYLYIYIYILQNPA
jgi:hypothetical protein